MKDLLADVKQAQISLRIAVSTPQLGSEILYSSFQHLAIWGEKERKKPQS
jgi:hypothetical protein